MRPISARVQIMQTGEQHDVVFHDVVDMMKQVALNATLAEMVLGITLRFEEPIVNDQDQMVITYVIKETMQPYMVVTATKM